MLLSLKRESLEIIADNQCFNLMEHALIQPSWNLLVMQGRKDIKEPSRETVMEETEEGTGCAENVFNQGYLGF